MRVFFVAFIALLATQAQASCRQALAIGLDVSGSVDDTEYRLQLDGLAGALTSPAVTQALLTFPTAPITLLVYDWAGTADQRVILPWTEIKDQSALLDAASRIIASPRAIRSQTTALGAALAYGADALRQQSCDQLTLDLAGDGKSNEGPRPRDIPAKMGLGDIHVNALVIGTDGENALSELARYFEAEVIHGPDAFVERATGFEDFQRAMTLKLLKEIEGLSVASLNRQ